MKHIPVLLQEVIEGLSLKNGDIVIDATVGGGGHAYEILKQITPNGTLFGFDKDTEALKNARKRLSIYKKNCVLVEGGYENMKEILKKHNIKEVDKILFDLGMSSIQLDDEKRGFSFKTDSPLDMRFSRKNKITAYDVVNTWREETLADIIYGFGEERYAKKIAKKIIEKRAKEPIKTTKELAEIVYESVPASYRAKKIHPATKTFQAIRIAVNAEIETLKNTLPIAFSLLKSGGRIATITFHSLEDRIVKRFFIEKKKDKQAKIITKKPITASVDEIKKNPRARSAKLRIIEKI